MAASRIVTLPDSSAGSSSYTLGADESGYLRAAAWRMNKEPPLDNAYPELLVFDQAGHLAARIEAPAVTSPTSHGWIFNPVVTGTQLPLKLSDGAKWAVQRSNQVDGNGRPSPFPPNLVIESLDPVSPFASYAVHTMPLPPGWFSPAVFDVNDNGDAVGGANDGTQWIAVKWTRTGPAVWVASDVTPPNPGVDVTRDTWAGGINNTGDIAGSTADPTSPLGFPQAFLNATLFAASGSAYVQVARVTTSGAVAGNWTGSPYPANGSPFYYDGAYSQPVAIANYSCFDVNDSGVLALIRTGSGALATANRFGVILTTAGPFTQQAPRFWEATIDNAGDFAGCLMIHGLSGPNVHGEIFDNPSLLPGGTGTGLQAGIGHNFARDGSALAGFVGFPGINQVFGVWVPY